MLRAILSLIVLSYAAAASAPAQAQTTAPVRIETGLVTGVEHGGVETYKGIPFAAPPVGALRWRAPQPAAAWTGVRAADRFGFMCMQAVKESGLGFVVRPEDMSEDCLTLNVFRPKGASGGLPVMVWIHGGSLLTGSSSIPAYDGEAFARGGVILVSINYRLGRLGIFAPPVLTAENADGGRLGNYGLMDQIAALQWVSRNIAAFGGDPKRVTIFGESAGALSVDTLMVSPEARGLFEGAISESGYGRGSFARVSTVAPDGTKPAEADGVELAAALGLKNPDLAALRAASATEIVANFKVDGMFSFILDGKTLTQDMWTAFREGKEAPVPFLLGSNSLEMPGADGKVRASVTRPYVDAAQEAALAKAYGGEDALKLNLPSDILFSEQVRALARLHAKNGHPTYVYLFSVVQAAMADKMKGALHAAELRYVFDTLDTGKPPITGQAETAVAHAMNGAWRAFAATGAPNAPGLARWPRYGGKTIMEFSLNGAAADPDARQGRLDALARLADPKS